MLLEEKSRLAKRKELVSVFYLKKGFMLLESVFISLREEKVLFLNSRIQKERKDQREAI